MNDLTYVGEGRFLVGFPARDLTDAELKELAEKRNGTAAQLRKALTDSGLYAEPKEKKEPKS